ncbi:hypothetical protein L6R50_08120 [Myxococcota bacterium]|nr:hypothetical protein [Myxococcota bacterium]
MKWRAISTAVGLLAVGSACTGDGGDRTEFGLVELTVLEGDVPGTGLPGVGARALLSVADDAEGTWRGSITFIDGGLLARMDPEGWSGPFALEGDCVDGTCHLVHGDPDGPTEGGAEPGDDLALDLSFVLEGTGVSGELLQVHRIDGAEVGRALLALEGRISGPASFDPGAFAVRSFRNGACTSWNGSGVEVQVAFDETERGHLSDASGLLTGVDGPISLPGVASGDHFYAFAARSTVDGSDGAECLDERLWWAEVAVEGGRMSGTVSVVWRRDDDDGRYPCPGQPIDCSSVYVLDPAG